MKFLIFATLLCISHLTFASYSYEVLLRDLGPSNGINSKAEFTSESVYLNLPKQDMIQSIELHVDNTFAPNLSAASYVRVSGNGKIVGYLERSQKTVFRIDPKEFMEGRGINFGFDLYSELERDVDCAPEAFFRKLIQLSGATKFIVTLNDKPQTINDYLLSLPRNFVVKSPRRALTPKEFTFLLQLKIYTRNIGKKMSMTYQEGIADIVLGDVAEITDYSNRFFNKVVNFDYKPLVRILKRKGKSFLGVNSEHIEFGTKNIFSFIEGFNTSRVSTIKMLEKLPKKNKQLEFQRVSNSEFQLSYSHSDLESSKALNQLNLSLSLSNKFNNEELVLNLYKNDKLIKVLELSSREEPQFFQLSLPTVSDRVVNTLTLKAFSKGKGDVCSRVSRFELSILPDTDLKFTSIELDKSNFIHFLKMRNHKAPLYIPQTALSESHLWLEYIDLFIKSSNIESEEVKLEFFDNLSEGLSEGGVLFTDKDNSEIIGVHRLNPVEMKTNFMEIAKIGSSNILHFHIAQKDEKVNLNYLELGLRDLSYFDGSRTLYTVNSKQEKHFNVDYSDKSSLSVLFRTYKVYFFIFFWLLITFFFIRFTRKKK